MKYEKLDTSQIDWYSVLPRFGVEPALIANPKKNGPCPIEGEGRTRFRFDNKDGRGTWMCNHCGAGGGVELIARMTGMSSKEAYKALAEMVQGRSGQEPIKPRKYEVPSAVKTLRDIEKARDSLKRTWAKGRAIAGTTVEAYLTGRIRGLKLEWLAPSFRCHPGLYHFDGETAKKGIYPAMLTRVVDAANPVQAVTIHRTYLDDKGHKAPVSQGQVKKVMSATVEKIHGESILLNTAVSDSIIVTEGIENGLAWVAALENAVTVYAALNCGNMSHFKWPQGTKKIVIAADHDPVNPKTGLRPGTHHAMLLRQRALDAGIEVVIRVPPLQGVDWDDMWAQGQSLIPIQSAQPTPSLQAA